MVLRDIDADCDDDGDGEVTARLFYRKYLSVGE